MKHPRPYLSLSLRSFPSLALLLGLLAGCSHSSKTGPYPLPTANLRAISDDGSVIAASDNLRVQVIAASGGDYKHYLSAREVIRIGFSLGSEEYHILPGDELAIQFQENSKLDLRPTVRPDGRLTLPGLGEIIAAGQTPLALAKAINDTYAGRMNRPDASVTVLKANTGPIDSLAGEFTIRTDGMVAIPLLGELKAADITPSELAERLGEAASERFKNKITAYVTTRERSTVQETIPSALIGLDKVFAVAPDGTITLPEVGSVRAAGRTLVQVRNSITKDAGVRYRNVLRVAVTIEPSEHRAFYVSGEVTKPGAYPLTGKMTAVKALAVAGGLTPEANMRGVVLLHYNADDTITVYRTSVKAMVGNGSAFTDIALAPQDVIFVPKTTIAQMDLFVQQYIEKLIPIGRSVSYSYTTFPKL